MMHNLLPVDDFLREAVGLQGVEALQKTTDLWPDLQAVVLPRVVISMLHVAINSGYQGVLPGTQALLKGEMLSYGGQEVSTADFPAACSLLCVAAGLTSLDLPARLQPKQVARLAKAIDLLAQHRFLKRVQELEASGQKSSKVSSACESTVSESDLGKAQEMPGRAAEPRGPQAPTPPAPQVKLPGRRAQQPNPAIGTQGIKKQ